MATKSPTYRYDSLPPMNPPSDSPWGDRREHDNDYEYARSYKRASGTGSTSSLVRRPPRSNVEMLVTYALPLAICTIALSLLWSFALTSFFRDDGILAPFALVTLYREQRQWWNFLLTVVAVMFSAGLGYAYAWSLRLWAISYMTRHNVATHDLSAWSSLCNKAVYFSRSRKRWALVTVLSSIMAGLFTPGFITLFTLNPIRISRPVSTTELDFTLPAFADVYDGPRPTGVGTACTWQQYRNATFPSCVVGNAYPDLLQAGRAASELYFNLSDSGGAVTRAGTYGFAGSRTGGVLPQNAEVVFPDVVEAYKRRTRDGDFTTFNGTRRSKYNTTLTIQGVRANVSCRVATEPSPIAINTTVMPAFSTNLTTSNWTTTCPPGSTLLPWPKKPVPTERSFMLGDACKNEAGGYQFYLRAGLFYAKHAENITCDMFPYPTLASVRYNGATGSYSVLSEVPAAGQHVSNFTDMLVSKLPSSITFGQTRSNNLLVEALEGVSTRYLKDQSMSVRTQSWEVFLGAFLEFLGTHNHHHFASLPGDPLPRNATREITGTFDYTMLGFKANGVTFLFITPITVIALLAIYLTVTAWRQLGQLPNFDPTSVYDLLEGSYAGYLKKVEFGEKEDHWAWAEQAHSKR